VPIVLKSGSLNRLKLSGPVQACNGIAFYHVFTKNPTYNGLGLNPKIRDGRSVVYCRRHGLALPTACEVSGVNDGKYISLVDATYMVICEWSVWLKADT